MNANSPAVTLAQAAAATPHPPPPAPTSVTAHAAPSTPNSAPAAPAVAGSAAAVTLTPVSVVPPPHMPVPLPATPATPATPSASAPGSTPAKHTRGPKAFWNHGRDLILFAGLQQLKLDGNLADSDLPKPAGYEQLAARINQEWGPPVVSVEQVRNRIKNLRAQYFRALRVLATPGVVGFNRQTAMIEAPMAVWEQLNGIDVRLAKFRDTSLEWLPLAQTMWPVAPGEITSPTAAAAAAAAVAVAASASAAASGTAASTAAPSPTPAIAPRVPASGHHHRTPRYASSRAAAAASAMTPPPPLAPAAVSPPPPALPPPSPSPPLHATLPPPPSSSVHHGPPPAKRPRTDDDAAFLGALSGLVTTFKEVHGGAASPSSAVHVPPAPPAPAKIDDVDLAMAHINHHYSVDAQVGAAVLFMDNKTAATMYLKLTDAARAPFLARILKLDVSVIRGA
ncbi:hypothetical protein AMAG_00010 [Allomyces macrogynus ATCC 38327]|uniref:Myb/SANT-like domain-containing protein n=1 Tax=Allomyces macrogynus (strain ATCC 38327) TaxID=578462 RepID=A0A0L0RVC0_ALLM3|nr:hypothetical protein AMAG_00010 [Allomyces macrogynus ATCC 38327]|eukprot:KNE54015.1 hypothetical protein AMAG_00010 [Allomyces macrogynus ATCC 38327]